MSTEENNEMVFGKKNYMFLIGGAVRVTQMYLIQRYLAHKESQSHQLSFL